MLYRKRRTKLPPKATVPWVRMVREPSELPTTQAEICKPSDVHRIIAPLAAMEEVEVCWVLILNTRNKVVAQVEVTRGILNSSLLHPREVFRLAVAHGAAGIVVAHNHPGGDPTPSADDRAVTRQLVEAGRVMDIPVMDHVVVGTDKYFSFAEAGLL